MVHEKIDKKENRSHLDSGIWMPVVWMEPITQSRAGFQIFAKFEKILGNYIFGRHCLIFQGIWLIFLFDVV